MNITNKKCILALSFGAGKNYGITNQSIARLVQARKDPVIAQYEIAMILQQNKIHHRNLEIIKEEPGEYLDSYKFLKEAKVIMNQKGYTDVILLGHQDHLPRIRKIAEKMGMTIIETVKHHLPYDPRSTQWWTRNKFLFCSREIIVTIHHKIKGWT